MSKTTDTRQVRMMFRELLIRYGIDDLQLEIDCVSVAKNYFEARLKTSDKVGARVGALQRQGSTKLRVEDTWKTIMRMEYVPWEGRNSTKGKVGKKQDWISFFNWLVEKETEQFGSVAKFCNWFVSDDFRVKTIAMYTPDGRTTDGSYSYKSIWQQAFTEVEEAPEPDDGGGIYV